MYPNIYPSSAAPLPSYSLSGAAAAPPPYAAVAYDGPQAPPQPFASAPPLVSAPTPPTVPYNMYQMTPPATPQHPVTSGPPRSAMPTSRVELTISAKNLLDMDTFTKSDPFCVLYQKVTRTNQLTELGRTEVVMNNLNPFWDKKFTIDYRFEERQVLKFSIYDWDEGGNSLAHHDYLGSLECTLGEVVAAPNKKFERNLVLPQGAGRKSSQLVILAEELGSNKKLIHLKMHAKKLDKKDFFGKSDPFVLISKRLDDGTYTSVCKTTVIKNTLKPNWPAISIRLATLTSDKPERPLKFQVFDWNFNSKSDLIGEFDTNYLDIESRIKSGNTTFSVINPKKRDKKKSYVDSGQLTLEWMQVEEEKTFLDYIQGGVQLHFTVAVDFTASNGDPSHPNSLHYRSSNADNQYSIAIKAVGEIIQDYDSNKLFPALGFGALVPPHQNVSHEFFLNGSHDNPYCDGISGVLQAYYHSLNTVQLYGPTYFAPVVNHVARFAAGHQDGKNYFVLLIITDGIICDMDATKEAVINASSLPMSIIIVGVGSEDFSAMEFLDSDDKLLSHNGRSAVRDIVQFVEMQKFMSSNYRQQHVAIDYRSKVNLAAEVLAELPDNVVGWMKSKSVRFAGGR